MLPCMLVVQAHITCPWRLSAILNIAGGEALSVAAKSGATFPNDSDKKRRFALHKSVALLSSGILLLGIG